MYIIRRPLSFRIYDYRVKYEYFTGFHDHFRTYGKKSNAIRFHSRAQAEAFLREKLGNPEDHKVVKE